MQIHAIKPQIPQIIRLSRFSLFTLFWLLKIPFRFQLDQKDSLARLVLSRRFKARERCNKEFVDGAILKVWNALKSQFEALRHTVFLWTMIAQNTLCSESTISVFPGVQVLLLRA